MSSVFLTISERAQEGADPLKLAEQLARDFQTVFESDAGHRVLANLLDRTGFFRSEWREGEENPGDIVFREGQRAVGLYILKQLRTTPATLTRFARGGETRELYEP